MYRIYPNGDMMVSVKKCDNGRTYLLENAAIDGLLLRVSESHLSFRPLRQNDYGLLAESVPEHFEVL